MNILLTWLGHSDIKQMEADQFAAIASIAIIGAVKFEQVIILANSWQDQWPT
ncbi:MULTISPECIES: hypothetical protein [Colwellia]|uniref:Uncharacterized protein n=1 Tax=Colwellia marinimaniae TaxID=1513592 RepID=A0ABQ0MZ17_9GAMM|nr:MULTISPECIES: hypothetical protein [Colwellia]GAW97623.1 hypothetical protein MTCD1_03261 [Colwellia marinimaniae]